MGGIECAVDFHALFDGISTRRVDVQGKLKALPG